MHSTYWYTVAEVSTYWYTVAEVSTHDRDALHEAVYTLPEEYAADWVSDTDRGGLVNLRFAPYLPENQSLPAVKAAARAAVAKALKVASTGVEIVNLTRESDMQLFDNI